MFIDRFGLTIPDLYCKSWLSVVSATWSILKSNDPFPVVAERGEKSAVNQREKIERGQPTLYRIVPLQVVLREKHESQTIHPQIHTHSTPIMEVNGFPIRIISRIKRTAIFVEFIREHQNHLLGGVSVRRYCVDRFRSFRINQPNMGRKIRNLSRSVDSTEVKTSLIRLFLGQKMGKNRIAFYLSADNLSHNGRPYQR